MTPLEWVCFAHPVRVSLSTHEQLYATTSGWTVREVAPLHIALSHKDTTNGRLVEVRGVGYTMLRTGAISLAEIEERERERDAWILGPEGVLSEIPPRPAPESEPAAGSAPETATEETGPTKAADYAARAEHKTETRRKRR